MAFCTNKALTLRAYNPCQEVIRASSKSTLDTSSTGAGAYALRLVTLTKQASTRHTHESSITSIGTDATTVLRMGCGTTCKCIPLQAV